MKKIFSAAFAFVLPLLAFSQEEEKIRRHEVALDVAPIFRNTGPFGGTPQLNLMYRYNMPKNALRLQLVGMSTSNNNNSTNTSENPFDTTETTSTFSNANTFLDIRPGIQWQTGGEKFKFYYGADAVIQYQKAKGENNFVFPFGDITRVNMNTSKFSSLGFGVAPVLGMRFQISDQFSISIENDFAVIYRMNTSENESISKMTNTSTGEVINENRNIAKSKGDGIDVSLSPITNIAVYLSFHF